MTIPPADTFRLVTVDDPATGLVRMEAIAIVCLLCGRMSHSREDVRHRYCGACHVFHRSVMEARAYHAAGMTHDCGEWRTAADRCAVCDRPLRQPTQQISPGVYVTDGALHLDLEELLHANGFADTPENRAMLTHAAHEVIRYTWPEIRIEEE